MYVDVSRIGFTDEFVEKMEPKFLVKDEGFDKEDLLAGKSNREECFLLRKLLLQCHIEASFRAMIFGPCMACRNPIWESVLL